jgi:gamma-glutamyl-gamma-aminobutyrate hydrolase PuuD
MTKSLGACRKSLWPPRQQTQTTAGKIRDLDVEIKFSNIEELAEAIIGGLAYRLTPQRCNIASELDIQHCNRERNRFDMLALELSLAKNLPLSGICQGAKLFGNQNCHLNSLHHQAIKKLGEGFPVTGSDNNNITQAGEAQNHRYQIDAHWHLEYSPFHARQSPVFKHLVASSMP